MKARGPATVQRRVENGTALSQQRVARRFDFKPDSEPYRGLRKRLRVLGWVYRLPSQMTLSSSPYATAPGRAFWRPRGARLLPCIAFAQPARSLTHAGEQAQTRYAALTLTTNSE